MATMALGLQGRRMSVGRVFERAFAAIRHNLIAALALALVLGVVPTVAMQYFILQVPSYALVMTVGSLVLPGAIALGLLRWFTNLVAGTLVAGAMARPVVAEYEGRKAGTGESLAAAGAVLIPLALLGLLFGIVVVIGTTLLVIPGLIVFLLWSVAAPALAAEREGVFLALSRSQELTEGARWKILAIVLILTVASLVISAVGALIVFAARGTTFMYDITWRLALTGALSLVVDLVWGAVQASLFVELRDWKEGGEDLGEVFA